VPGRALATCGAPRGHHCAPDVRENEKILGNLITDFDFSSRLRPPVLLPVHPATTLTGTPDPAHLPAAAKAPDGDG
jgi:hypothetical protein